MSVFQSAVPVKLSQAALTTSAVLLYTVPANTRTIVKYINIVNTTAGALTVDVYLLSSGGTATTNALIYHESVASHARLLWSGVAVMNSGDLMYALGSATGLTLYASGAECT